MAASQPWRRIVSTGSGDPSAVSHTVWSWRPSRRVRASVRRVRSGTRRPVVESQALEGSSTFATRPTRGPRRPDPWGAWRQVVWVGSERSVRPLPPGRTYDVDIVRLVHAASGWTSSPARSRAPAPAVPFDGTCLLTVDPATLLPTGEVVENGLPPTARVRLGEIELREPDFNKFAALARADVPAASLSEATEGDLDQSIRQREVRRPSGFDDELRAVLTEPTGRGAPSPCCARPIARLHAGRRPLRRLAGGPSPTASAGRRSSIDAVDDTGARPTPGSSSSRRRHVEMANHAAERWLDELARAPLDRPADGRPRGRRPGPATTRPAPARRLAAPGSARAGPLGRRARLARTARPGSRSWWSPPVRPELAPLIADAYGFTERERIGHRAGGAGPDDQRDRRPAAPVGVHGAGPPEGDLREVRARAHAAISSPACSSTTTCPASAPRQSRRTPSSCLVRTRRSPGSGRPPGRGGRLARRSWSHVGPKWRRQSSVDMGKALTGRACPPRRVPARRWPGSPAACGPLRSRRRSSGCG